MHLKKPKDTLQILCKASLLAVRTISNSTAPEQHNIPLQEYRVASDLYHGGYLDCIDTISMALLVTQNA